MTGPAVGGRSQVTCPQKTSQSVVEDSRLMTLGPYEPPRQVWMPSVLY